jgi:trehalose 6-phosphate synthase/phosphatase
MPEEERRSRMRALRDRVKRNNVQRWADTFIATLAELRRADRPNEPPSSDADIAVLVERARSAPRLVLLLDYDGTLAPIAPTPDLASPTGELLQLLAALARRPSTAVFVVSGRSRDSLDKWLGELDVGLYAEHGLWRRPVGQKQWSAVRELSSEWKESVRAILAGFVDRTPGSFYEEKAAGLAWHYRLADAELGPLQARELTLHLTDVLSNTPVEVMHGHKVIEVRQQGVNKGLVVGDVLAHERNRGAAFLFAIGDDRTDEDLFTALPDDEMRAMAVHVGGGPTRAQVLVPDTAAVHRLLRSLL